MTSKGVPIMQPIRLSLVLWSFLTVFSLPWIGCNSSDVKTAIDIADGIPRRPIDTSILGINAFNNDARFGSIRAQFLEVRDVLRLRYVRILMSWNDAVQPSPGSSINFSFYDDLAANLPSGVEALVVVTGVPSWMRNAGNWIDGNPRRTFVELFFSAVVARYGGNSRITAFQAWNEPNNPSFAENSVIEVLNSPENFVELVAFARNAIDQNAPGRLLLPGATTAINQNFSSTLNYNRAMRDAGMQSFVDRWAIHYYGKQYENLVQDGGVADFLNGLDRRIWVTESGAQGVNSQLAYGEEVWPFLTEQVPGIERIYVYQFTEDSPAMSTYGLRNPDAGMPVSDLYVFLRDR